MDEGSMAITSQASDLYGPFFSSSLGNNLTDRLGRFLAPIKSASSFWVSEK
ncbi:hypothetical protein PGTUg99_021107 [Puccinia graminis f. sp. tritici]|uniref:Uncharacterized protein n=1 Tax=Puccinia graminis f. sp. tritici TaxID=56615 RepID=A0A5B0S5P3_PUCGR|nr:hypothetical protein PGTUg99_021107 [Puccinia graminis f. sp. tritici]